MLIVTARDTDQKEKSDIKAEDDLDSDFVAVKKEKREAEIKDRIHFKFEKLLHIVGPPPGS